jgi:hypothetical protein
MPAKPNFTDVNHTGDAVVLTGQSDPEPAGDIVDIRVVLTQGGKVESAVVPTVGDRAWLVDVPAAGFAAGPAVAIGIETRREDSVTVTWTQAVQIPAAPG